MRNQGVLFDVYFLLISYNLNSLRNFFNSHLINEVENVVSGISTERNEKCRFGNRSTTQSQSHGAGVPQSGETNYFSECQNFSSEVLCIFFFKIFLGLSKAWNY